MTNSKTRPLCEVVDPAERTTSEVSLCICRWPAARDEGGALKGHWWVEVDRNGIAYTGYTEYAEIPW